MKQTKLVKKLSDSLKQLKCNRYLHHYGPKKYKFVEHAFALLIKEVCQMSFRRLSSFLNNLGISCPTYSALCKSRKRIPLSIWQKLLKLTAGLSSGEIAIDGTGYHKTNPSFHYIKRIDRQVPTRGYVKLSAFVDVKTKKFRAIRVRSKQRHDVKDVKYLLKQDDVKVLYGDTGYCAEWIHELCYWTGIKTVIKPRKKFSKGYFRRKQFENHEDYNYGLRSNVECGFSCIKRKYGTSVKSKKIAGLRAELYLRAIAHNMRLLLN